MVMRNPKIAMMVLAIVLLASVGASAQSAVVVNPLGFVFGVLSGEYESARSSDTTLAISGLYWSPELGVDFDITALGAGVGIKKYLQGELFNGVYLSGGVVGALLTGKYQGDKASGVSIGANASAGMKWLFDGGFLIDLGLGVTLPLVTFVTDGDISGSDVGGAMGTAISFGLGYAW